MMYSDVWTEWFPVLSRTGTEKQVNELSYGVRLLHVG